MATLVDFQIEELSINNQLISPYEPSQLNPASYDVRLGENFYIEMPDGAWQKRTAPYLIAPGEFVLAEIRETLKLPADIEAQFQLKSSRGREGYEHVMSGYIDPGYNGIITLELVNVCRYKALPLMPDILIGQIRFMKTDAPCRSPYWDGGHYQGDTGVTPSRVDLYGQSTGNS
jgi:dCTP deaminase